MRRKTSQIQEERKIIQAKQNDRITSENITNTNDVSHERQENSYLMQEKTMQHKPHKTEEINDIKIQEENKRHRDSASKESGDAIQTALESNNENPIKPHEEERVQRMEEQIFSPRTEAEER